MKRRLLSFLTAISLALALSVFPAADAAQTVTQEFSSGGKAVGRLSFTLNEGDRTAVLVSADPDRPVEGMLTVPHTVTCEGETYTVTTVGPGALAGQTGLTQLWLPHTVTEIGSEAFMNCDHLTAVGTYDDQGHADPYALPPEISSVGSRVFRGCTRLNSVTIPAKVERIGAWAFAYCYNLGRNYRDSAGVTYGVYFAEGSRLTSIGQGAFYSCISLENITLPQGLRSISLQAFSHCASQGSDGTLHGLKALPIPSSVTEIGEEAFSYCGALRSVSVPAGLRALPAKAFYACSALETVDFTGDGLVSMGHSAFYWCTRLHTIRTAGTTGLPATLTAIPRWGFYRCDSLAELDLSRAAALREIEPYAFNESGVVRLRLPQGLKTIGMLAFEGCGRLTSIDWNRPERDEDLLIVGEKAFAKTGLTQVTVPQLLAGSGNGLEMFYDCDALVQVRVAPNTRFIPDGLCRDCDSLTSVVLSDSLEAIGQQAFYSCPKLTDVELSSASSLSRIGPMAFCRAGLTVVSLPASIREIGLNAFGIDRALTSIEIGEGNPGGYYSVDGVLYQNKGSSLLLVKYPAGKAGAVFEVPEGITTIESYAFSHSEKLNTVTFPTSLRVIGYYALSHCINLTTANVPDDTAQGAEIFEGSYHMTQVTLPPDITELTSSSFPVNSKVTSVTLPASVAEIDTISPFSSLSLFREINVDSTNPNFKSVDGVLFSKDGTILYAYPRGKTDSEYTVPDGVITIWSSAFANVTNLKRLTLPASVTTIRPSACYGMTGLERLDILRETPAVSVNPNLENVYNQFLIDTGSQLQVYINGDPTDQAGVNDWIDSFASACVGSSSLPKQNVHVGFCGPVSRAGDRFLERGVIYTLADPAARTVTIGANTHYEGNTVLIPAQVVHNGVAYTVTAVENNAFPRTVELIRREDLTAFTPDRTDLVYGDILTLTAPTGVRDGATVTLTANGRSLSASLRNGAASFPVDKAMADAFGFGTVSVRASGGESAGEFSLTLSPKTFTRADLPWYNSSLQYLVIQKPYDGTTVLDYTSSDPLRDFTVNGDDLSLRITGSVPAPVSNTLHSISGLKLELVGGMAGYYRLASDVAQGVRAQVTYGQLYLKEENGILQQPSFRRVWAAEDGMRLMDCALSGGAFVAYLPTVENNVITGYTQVDVAGSLSYDEVNHYPGLASFEEMGVQQNQSYRWVFTPSDNGELQTALENYRFFGTVTPWDTDLAQGSAGAVGRTGENPPLPAYVLQAQSGDEAPIRPTDRGGAAAATPSAPSEPPASPSPSPAPSPSAPSGSGGSSGSASSSAGSGYEPAPAESPSTSEKEQEAPVCIPVDQLFRDIAPGKWYRDAVQYVCDRGIMKGMGKDSFAPTATTSRGTLVTMLYRLEREPAVSSAAFQDVPDGRWYAGGVAWAASAGLVQGYGNDLFRPNDPITREQIATILYRYAAAKGYNVSARAISAAFRMPRGSRATLPRPCPGPTPAVSSSAGQAGAWTPPGPRPVRSWPPS